MAQTVEKGGGQGLRPVYADELGKQSLAEQMRKDKELVELRKQADELFGKHAWRQAQSLFEKLSSKLLTCV